MRSYVLSLLIAAIVFGSAYAEKSFAAETVNIEINDCTQSFENLTLATTAVTSLTNKEQWGLTKISMDAQHLYTIGKTADALTKLNDYRVKLDQLAGTLQTPKPKISTADEHALRAAVNEAIACVSGF